MQLILASKSYDRKRILKRLDIPFISIPSKFDENSVNLIDPKRKVKEIAYQKAKIVKNIWLTKYSHPKDQEAVIIAADTMGYYGGNLYGKPADKREAFDIIKKLVGKEHLVYTGVSILHSHSNHTKNFLSESIVHFQMLTDQ